MIYFTPSREFTRTFGLANVWTTTFGNRIVEADVFINTQFEEEEGYPVAEIGKLSGYDGPYGVWLYYNSAYITILHELGHALGLGHIPVSGNIMSYSRWENFRGQWEAPMALYINMLHERFGKEATVNDFFVDHEEFNRIGSVQYTRWMPITNARARILTNFYTSKLRLGELEKMLLACSYEF